MPILLASANLGKIREIKAILTDSGLDLLSIIDADDLAKFGIKIPADFEVLEIGQTFRENALLKARAYAQLSNLPCIADDSGLEVEALSGFPSVYSNRWFQGSAKERNLALLEKMQKQQNRQARFRTVICFFNPQLEEAKFFNGEIKGRIASAIRGNKMEGFGYDPIFIPEGYEQSFAELGNKVKNEISHRRQALLKLNQFLVQDKRLELLE